MKSNNCEASPAIDSRFLDILSAHKNGEAITDVSSAIKQVTSAVQLTGKGGHVVLTINIKPASKGSVGTLVVETRIKSKVPEVESYGSVFYADADYNLVREDPNQKKLDLKIVGSNKQDQPLKEVGAE